MADEVGGENSGNLTVASDSPGAVVGNFALPDGAGDGARIEVSDDRFEIVDGQLKLKDDESVNSEDAAALDISVTITDADGNETTQDLNISVEAIKNEDGDGEGEEDGEGGTEVEEAEEAEEEEDDTEDEQERAGPDGDEPPAEAPDQEDSEESEASLSDNNEGEPDSEGPSEQASSKEEDDEEERRRQQEDEDPNMMNDGEDEGEGDAEVQLTEETQVEVRTDSSMGTLHSGETGSGVADRQVIETGATDQETLVEAVETQKREAAEEEQQEEAEEEGDGGLARATTATTATGRGTSSDVNDVDGAGQLGTAGDIGGDQGAELAGDTLDGTATGAGVDAAADAAAAAAAAASAAEEEEAEEEAAEEEAEEEAEAEAEAQEVEAEAQEAEEIVQQEQEAAAAAPAAPPAAAPEATPAAAPAVAPAAAPAATPPVAPPAAAPVAPAAVPQAPTPVSVSASPINASEDGNVPLNISLGPITGSNTVTVTVGNLPTGAVLSAGTQQADGSWSLSATDLNGLTVQLPENVSGSFNLSVNAQTTSLNGLSSRSATATTMNIEAVADTPTLNVNAGENADGTIDLQIDAGLTDLDGSESLTVEVRGLPEGTVISDGTASLTVDASGTADVTSMNTDNLTITPEDGTTDLTFNVVAVSVDGTSVAESSEGFTFDLNDAPTDVTLDNASVNENADGAVIGNVTVVDPDAGDTHTLEVSDSRFEIVDGQLKLKEGVTLDHEAEPNVSVQVTATDAAGESVTQTFDIDVADLNEAQTDINLDGATVDENAEGAVIGDVTIVDPDAGDTQTITVSDDRFEVVDGQLKLKDGVTLDYEAEPNVSVEITATDAAGNTISETFDIDVADINEQQTDITLDGATVDENADGAVIGDVTIVDPDAGDTQTITVSDDRFEVVDGQLKLKDGVTLDYEAEPNVSVEITATDAAGNTISETFDIDVADINEQQTDITLDGATVDENADGAVIGDVTIIDPDAGDTQTITVSDDRFEIVDGQLKLKDGVTLDYEAEPTVSVEITATDAAGNTISETFDIDVADINEQQTDITLDGATVDENADGAVIGDVTIVDPDAGDTQTITVSDDRFEIVDGQLKLKDGVTLDYEAEPNVSVEITATDAAGNTISETFDIDVADINEQQTDITLDGATVDENADGAVIGDVTIVDPDAGDTQTITVSDDRFEIVDGQLKLKDGVTLDYEAEPNVSVEITATDAAGNVITETFDIDVADINEAPTDITLDQSPIKENDAGAVVGTITVVDPDQLDQHTFEVSDDRFEIVDGQLKLKDGESINFEEEPNVFVEVTATDSAGNQFTQQFDLDVTDVNETPFDLSVVMQNVPEDVTAGTVVGQATARDADAGDSITYTLENDADGRFVIDPVSGAISVAEGVELDFEDEASFEITVRAEDANGLFTTSTTTVEIADVNEAPTDIDLSNLTIIENQDGAVVGDLVVSDQDGNDTHTFTVSDDRFEVVNGQLKLKEGEELDFNTAHNVYLEVTATDAGGQSFTKAFTLEILDANEAPTDIGLSNLIVSENEEGAVIGDVTVVDPDAGDSHTFTVSDDRFEIVDGQLKLKDGESLDFETAQNISIDVTATDANGESITETFTLEVTNVNEAPTTINLDNNQTVENEEGVVIGDITVIDPDAGDTHTFEVSDDRFEVVNGQLKLKEGVTLDHEAEPNVIVEVTAIDQGGESVTQSFDIDVADINEAPADLVVELQPVPENATAGTVVGQATANDPDLGDTITFSLDDNGGGRFAIDGITGVISVAEGADLNFEDDSQFQITVRATDEDGQFVTSTSTIELTDVNEAPTEIILDNLVVNENAEGEVIGDITVVDQDAGDSHSFVVTDPRFEVVDNQLKLKEGVSLDHEEAGTISVSVIATDEAGNEVTQTFEIEVANVNEAPTDVELSNATINENDDGAVVGQLAVFDPDAGDTHTFEVSDDRFEVIDGQLKLKDGVTLNHEEAANVTVEVTATDAAGETVTETFSIDVLDVEEAPTDIALDNLVVGENTPGGVIGNVNIVDPDAGDQHVVTVSDERFEIVNGQLKLKEGVSLNHEAEPTVSVEITATDATGLTRTETFSIEVEDINEAPTDMVVNVDTISEGIEPGTIVGQASAIDPDAGDVITYSLADDAGGLFEIDPSTGEISIAEGAEFDDELEYNITVVATDEDGLSTTQSIEIDIFDANDAPTDIALDNLSVSENVEGAVIGQFEVTDVDDNEHTITVSDDRFEVVDGQLKLKDGISLDSEEASSISIEVTATDPDGASFTEIFEIQVGDVNEAPTDIQLDNATISENAEGAVVGDITVIDPDAGDTQTITVSDDRFEVVDGQLKLKDGVTLDHEAEPNVSVEITATDAAGNTISETFDIDVADINEAPTSISVSMEEFDQTTPAGTVVGQATVSDPDDGDTITYSLADDGNGNFTIDAETGEIKIAEGAVLDDDVDYNLTVVGTDSAGNEISESLVIDINDENDAPMSGTVQLGDMDEDNSIIITEAELLAKAKDADGDTLSVSSVQDPEHGTIVDNGDGTWTYTPDQDYNGADMINFTISDGNGGFTGAKAHVQVDAVNDDPVALADVFIGTEDTPLTITPADLLGNDADVDGDALQITGFTQPEVGGTVTQNGEGAFVFTPDPDFNGPVTFEYTIDDGVGGTSTATVTVNVGEVDDAPTDIALDNATVGENADGAVIGELSVTDVDTDTHAITVSDDRFEVVDGQLKLKDGVTLDYEAEPTVSVEITATDAAGNVITETFDIDVADINEQQTDINLDGATVDENADGAVIGDVTIVDPDAGDTQTITVSDDRFEVVDGQLKLKDGVTLDYEAEPTVSVEITATDAAGNTISETFDIDVADINEQQTDITLDGATVDENADGAVIGDVTIVDPDAGDAQTLTVSDDRFEIVDGQLKLKDGVTLDYEAEPTVSVEITATDAAGNTITETFDIDVADINEQQTDINLDGATVDENADGAVIGDVTIVDPDAGDAQTLTVSDDRFEVVDGQLKLKDGVTLDYEAEPNVSVEITATDAAGNVITETFDIDVADINEQQTNIDLNSTTVDENAAGAVVGDISVIDPDAGDTQTITVSDDRFEVVDGQLKLKDGVTLDHEAEPTVSVEITATDSAGNTLTETFDLDVAEINEAPTDIDLDNASVDENAAGAVIGDVTVVDPDAGDTQTLTVSDDRFEVVDGQLKLKDGVTLDYEAEPTVSVEITATDAAGNTLTEAFDINVADINEAPTDIVLEGNEVTENDQGAIIGDISVVDPDAGDSHTITVSDDRFEVVDGQLKLKDGVSLDYEAAATVTVEVTATDEDGFAISENFTINVDDVTTGVGEEINQAPLDIDISNLDVDENQAGAIIGDITVVDPDAGDTHTFSVSDDRFEVVDGQLKLKDGVSLDYEAAASIDVTVTATDSAGGTYAEEFTVNVGDIDEGKSDKSGGSDKSDKSGKSGKSGGSDQADDGEGIGGAQYDGVTISAGDAEQVEGTSGSDDIDGGKGEQLVTAGAGDDIVEAGQGDDIVLAGSGDDEVEGGQGDDILLGGDGDDTIDGGSGDDTLYGNAGTDTIEGGSGDDTIYGGAGDDILSGDSGIDVIFGGDGDDTIDGGSGDDILSGGAGDDNIFGGAGNDLFLLGADGGNDSIHGGSGTDELDISAMAEGQGWTVSLNDGSEIAGTGEGYLDLTSESSGTITFDDGTEVNFEGLEKLTFGG